MRVSSVKYKSNTIDNYINLTNLSYHSDRKSKISKTQVYSKQGFYAESYPRIKEATKIVVERIKSSFVNPGKKKGYEIMGFDYILDTDNNPYLLEINRHVGYPYNARNKGVVNLVFQMLKDTVNLAIKPLIDSSIVPEVGGWEKF